MNRYWTSIYTEIPQICYLHVLHKSAQVTPETETNPLVLVSKAPVVLSAIGVFLKKLLNYQYP